MSRWIFAVGMALATGVACSSSSNGNGGDGDGGGCPCLIPVEAGAVSIPCKSPPTCVEGTAYICEQTGVASPQGPCVLDDASMMDVCVPHCPTNSCGADGCGGVCHCQTGSICVGGVCGNGCSGGAGDYCVAGRPDGGSPTTCCGVGYECKADDAGAEHCCSITSESPCGMDQDCCDYPAVHCNTIPTDAGIDSGTFLAHVCN